MKTKKIMGSGLAFDSKWVTPFFNIQYGEAADMDRLAAESRKGWHVSHIKGLSYVLVEGEPQNLVYTVDYKDNPDEEYFEIFKMAGWDKVTSEHYIHLFKAPNGTPPIHSDIDSVLEILTTQKKRFGIATLITGVLFTASIFLNTYTKEIGNPWLINTALALNLLAIVALVFTLMPFIGYSLRMRKTKKQKI